MGSSFRNGGNGISLYNTSIADVIGGEGFAIAQRIDSKGGNEAKVGANHQSQNNLEHEQLSTFSWTNVRKLFRSLAGGFIPRLNHVYKYDKRDLQPDSRSVEQILVFLQEI